VVDESLCFLIVSRGHPYFLLGRHGDHELHPIVR
jgi:hypothetical protein